MIIDPVGVGTNGPPPPGYVGWNTVEFPWNRIGPLVTVPYLPTLGAVHPGAVGPAVWDEVLDVAGTGRWLPHDKDARWGGDKPESVIDVVAGDGHVLVATLLQRDSRLGTVRVHCYGPPSQRAIDAARVLAGRLVGRRRAGAGRLVWFLPPGHAPQPTVAATRIQLCALADPQAAGLASSGEPAGPVVAYGALPPSVAGTFAAFAQAMADDGFVFLYGRMLSRDLGPVLTVTADQRVVGAIGPMAILADPAGRSRLLPQYFGVLPTHRGRGLGRALWRAAMVWGAAHGADYEILSTVVGGASDRLCRAEGLTDLGVVCATDLER